nr:MAG: hypothetical protein 3 [Leviviridae sp.]
MSRALSHEVGASYRALLRDVRALEPNLVSYLEPVIQRLTDLVRTRGPRVVCIDLPSLGKLFDKSLSRGYFEFSQVPRTLGTIEKGSFMFHEVFSDYVYEPHTGCVYTKVDPTAVFLLRTFMYLWKGAVKEPIDGATEEAVSQFFRTDSELRAPTLSWGCDDLDTGVIPDIGFARSLRESDDHDLFGSWPTRVDKGLLLLLDRVCRISTAMFGILQPDELCGRHGPGAVADVRTGEDKYLFPFWPNKLGRLFPDTLHAYPNEWISYTDAQARSLHEPPARLLAVPKSMKTPRLITSEPTAHQFLQQGLLRWLRKHLPSHLRICLDFSSQEPSRAAALEASKYGESATVDLSSASDRLSLWTVERAFAGNSSVLSALHATRTRYVRDCAGDPSRDYIHLRKYAGQGNATTFPVQSIIYSLVCITCVLYEQYGSAARVTAKSLRKAAGSVRVYGDDIILPSPCVRYLAECFEFLQLKINWEKTHIEGHFRESCGMDAFEGYDVTPLYMQSFGLPDKPSGEELVSWIDVSNNAYMKGLWSLSTWMIENVPISIARDIPVSPNPLGCVSLRTHTRATYFRKVRFNQNLHRKEVYGYVLTGSEVRAERNTYASLLQYFVERPVPDGRYTSGYSVRKRSLLRKRWVPAE